MDEPDAKGHVCAKALAGQKPAPRGARADLREDEGGDDGRDDPEAHLAEPEDGVLGRHRDVDAGDEPASAPECVPVHAGNHRRRAAVDHLAHAVEAHGVLDVLLVGEIDRRALPFDVRSRTEARALAGEDDRARVPHVGEGVGELADERRVERVAALGPCKRHPQDVTVSLDAQRVHAAQLKVAPVIHGALAAALTPLQDGGSSLDEEAFEPYFSFLAEGGLDGVLAMGTTGEGLLFSVEERRRVTELCVAAAHGRLQVAVHCGAQTTADTVALAEHAAGAGADAVAVIGPPYFRLDGEALFEHFRLAAAACASTPFYLYEFEVSSGYAIPLDVVERVREAAPNLAGLKVSDSPFEKVQPYLVEGLDVFVGAEALLADGLAAAFPEKVAGVVREPSAAGARELGEIRAKVERFPRHAALKLLVAERGVPMSEEVRAPLRRLRPDERQELLRCLG